MKIKDFSAEKGLTKQAVYKAISRAGFSAKQITDRNGNITSKGFSVLRSLFPDDPETGSNQGESSGSGDQLQQDAKAAAEIESLKAERAALQFRIDELEREKQKWEKLYFDAVESAKEEAHQLRVLISQEQQLRLAAENKGFFRRLFAGKKETENQ